MGKKSQNQAMMWSARKLLTFYDHKTSLFKHVTHLPRLLPNARIIPNRVVVSTPGSQCERWKQATFKELQAFLKTAWKEPTPELRARYFAAKMNVVMQLLVVSNPWLLRRKRKDWWVMCTRKHAFCLQGQTISRIPRPMQMPIVFVCS